VSLNDDPVVGGFECYYEFLTVADFGGYDVCLTGLELVLGLGQQIIREHITVIHDEAVGRIQLE